MADLKITDVPQGSSVASTDEFYIKTGNNFRRVSLTKLFTLLTSQGFFSIPVDGIKTTDLAIEKVIIAPGEEGYVSNRTYSQILASEDSNFEIQPVFETNDGAWLRGVVVDITDSEAIFAFLVPGPGPHISVFAVTDLQVTETVIPLFGQPCRAVCNTEEESIAKVASVQGATSDLFSLYDGATVYVYFTNAAFPGSTLNVNNTGAKLIDFCGTTSIQAESYAQLFYHEALGHWILVGGNSGGGGLTDELKLALLDWCAHTSWDDTDGQDRYDALEAALYPDAHLVSITAAYDQDRPIYDTDSLDLVRLDLVVTANYSDGTSETLADDAYTLSGTLVAGETCEITVSYGGKTAEIEVTVSMHYVYRMSTGDIEKIVGTTDGGIGSEFYITANTKRRVFALRNGRVPLKEYVDGNLVESDYYPFPVPSDATSVTVSITPNTQFFNISYLEQNVENATNKKYAETGWQQGSYTYTIPAGTVGTNRVLGINAKYNSSGGTYSTEPTEFVVQFNTT